MKNTRLKNVIFTAGMAIFTGVLLLGVNAAIGAATPTVHPPGGNVSPNFTGVVITGISDLQGNLLNSAGNVSVSDDLAVTGNVSATGQLTVGGTAISSDGDVLLVNDMLRVGGGLLVDGPGSRIDGDYINVNAVLRANESIINMANGGDDPVLIDDDLTISNGRTLLNQGNMETWGYAGFAGDIHMDLYESEDGDITGVDDIQLDGEISNPVPNADVVIDDDLTVNGNVLAERFGTYSYNLSSYVTLSPGEHDDILYTCPAGSRLVSCGYFSSDDINTGSGSWTKWIVVTRIIPNTTNNRCEIWGTNTHATEDRYLRAYGVCLDPDA